MHQINEIRWSSSGKRFFVQTGWELLTLDRNGIATFHGVAAETKQSISRIESGKRKPFDYEHKLEMPKARWAGNSDTSVVVGSADSSLHILDVQSGRNTILCPYPPGFVLLHGAFEVSDDLSTICFFSSGPAVEEKDQGVWIWRRWQKAPVQVLKTPASFGALSGDGKYFVAKVMEKTSIPTVLCESASGRILWQIPEVTSCVAFDRGSKRLAVSNGYPSGYTGKLPEMNLYCLTLADMRLKTLRKEHQLNIQRIVWSTDGNSLFCHVLPAPSYRSGY